MYTTGLVVNAGERTICLYFAGRAQAGEDLDEVLARRETERGPPIVMSDALFYRVALQEHRFPGLPQPLRLVALELYRTASTDLGEPRRRAV